MTQPRISAILLAAGLSSRMGGRNKMLLPFQENIVIQHSYNQLLNSQIEEIVVVGGMGFEDLVASLQFRDSDHLVLNTNFEKGMTSSIQTGLKYLNGEAFMVCLGDMPLLKNHHYNRLINHFRQSYVNDKSTIVLPEVNGQRGNPVIFSNHYREEVLAHEEPNGCKSVIENNINHLVKLISTESEYLIDIDTPEDYQRLLHGTD